MKFDLIELFENSFSKNKELIAFQEGKKQGQWKYSELEQDVKGLANSLRELGLKEGQAVTIAGRDTYKSLVGSLGTIFAGGITTGPMTQGADTQSSARAGLFNDIVYAINGTNSRMIILDSFHYHSFADKWNDESLKELSKLEWIIVDDDVKPQSRIKNLSRLIEKGKIEDYERPKIDSDSPASCLLTSGTTAQPKIVEISHYALATNSVHMGNFIDLQPGTRVFMVSHPKHILGQNAEFAVLNSGAHVITYTSRKHLMSEMAKIKYDILIGPPFLVRRLIKNTKKSLGTKLKQAGVTGVIGVPLIIGLWHRRNTVLFLGGGKVDEEALEFMKGHNVGAYEGYGTTEAGIVSVNWKGKSIIGTLGYPFQDSEAILNGKDYKVPGVELIFDESGVSDAGETTYRLLVKSPATATRYLNNRKASKEKFLGDGVVDTGDLVTKVYDETNDIFVPKFFTRKDNLIVRGNGENVSPAIIKDNFMQSPFVGECKVSYNKAEDYIFLEIEPDLWGCADKIKGLAKQVSRVESQEELHYDYGAFIGYNKQIEDLIKADLETRNLELRNFQRINVSETEFRRLETTISGKVKIHKS